MTFADLSVLDQYAAAPFTDADPPDIRTLYSPVDRVHAALVALIGSAQVSVSVAMYGFDDQELADILLAKLRDPDVQVMLTLDRSQAGGVHERAILSGEAFPASSIAVGSSEHNAIMHLKEIVVDGVIRISGSTNWSGGGEGDQDNELTVILDPAVAIRATARHAAIHQWMLDHPHYPAAGVV
jgi:phosphatidylserine/phosphatidylglycerophosphate/cardiolipin synthase-like enzyme